MVCLDTTVLIDLSRGRDRARTRRAAEIIREHLAVDEEVVTTRFNIAELHVGDERLSGRAQSQEAERVQRTVARLEVLEFGADAACVFARTTAHLQQIGRPARDMDVLIASVAIANGHALVTRNARHFARIPGLELLSYR